MEENTEKKYEYDYYNNFPPTVLVRSIDLCKELIDMGYLKNLKSVKDARYDNSKRVYYFDDIDNIKNYVNQHLQKKRAENAERDSNRSE